MRWIAIGMRAVTDTVFTRTLIGNSTPIMRPSAASHAPPASTRRRPANVPLGVTTRKPSPRSIAVTGAPSWMATPAFSSASR